MSASPGRPRLMRPFPGTDIQTTQPTKAYADHTTKEDMTTPVMQRPGPGQPGPGLFTGEQCTRT